MPFYEYQCSACGRVSEVMQKFSDPPLKKCPNCGKSKLQKLVSAPVFRLKGSGWYETDFKGDSDKKRNLAGAEVDTKAETKAETKTEAKAETKTDSKGEAKPDASAKPAESKAEAPTPTAASRSASKGKPAKKPPAKKKARR
jgi:putative FmdB family regulatory protein